jgi:hypothetical protein
VRQYLAEVLPPASDLRVADSCGGWLGLSPAVAVFDVTLPTWSRQASLPGFVDEAGKPVGLAATVLDGKDCLRHLRPDAEAILFGPLPGLYFQSRDQSVLVVLPDGHPGLGILFTQGR